MGGTLTLVCALDAQGLRPVIWTFDVPVNDPFFIADHQSVQKQFTAVLRQQQRADKSVEFIVNRKFVWSLFAGLPDFT